MRTPPSIPETPVVPARLLLVDAVGLACTLGYVTLAYLARQSGEPQLSAFLGIVAWTAIPVFGLYVYFRRIDEPFPVGRLIFWAVVFRLCGLIGGPFYEDDFYRYLWDGYLFATAGTPYGATPEDFFIDQTVPLALQAALNEINHPELPTIYGPTTQFVFLLGYWLQPGGIATLQSLLIAVDLATLALLLRLAPPAQRPALRMVSTGHQGSSLHGPPRRSRRMPAAGCHRPRPEAALA